jgi:hypothetical protein
MNQLTRGGGLVPPPRRIPPQTIIPVGARHPSYTGNPSLLDYGLRADGRDAITRASRCRTPQRRMTPRSLILPDGPLWEALVA